MKGWEKVSEVKGKLYKAKYRNTLSGVTSPVVFLYVSFYSLGQPEDGHVRLVKANGESIASRHCKDIPTAIRVAEAFMKRNPEFYKLG